MKTWRIAGLLALIFLALGGLATWDEWQTKRDQAAEGLKNRLVTFKPEEVVELEFVSKGSASAVTDPAGDTAAAPTGPVAVTAARKDGAWRLVAPVAALADARQIDAMIETITSYTYTKEVADDKAKWAEFGLQDPERQVTLRTDGAPPQVLTVFIGDKVPVGYNVYFRTSASDKVYMGSQHLLTSTNKSAFDFRDKTLTMLDPSKVTLLRYAQRGQAPIEMVRREGTWQIVQPETLDADKDEIQDFMNVIARAKVAEFNDQPSAAVQAAFAAPDFTVTWQDESGAATTLQIIDQAGKLQASLAPAQMVFGLPDDLRPKLQRDLLRFRNRRIFGGDLLGIKQVEVDGEAYANVQGRWYKAADAAKFNAEGVFSGDPKAAPSEAAHIRTLLVDIEFAKTDSFIAPDDQLARQLGADPEHRIVLQYDDAAKAALTLELFRGDADAAGKERYLVRTSVAPVIYRVPKATFNSLTPAVGGDTPATAAPQGDDTFLDDEEGLELDGPTGSSSPAGGPLPADKPG